MATDLVFRIAVIAKRQRRIGALREKADLLQETNDDELRELLTDLGVGGKKLDGRLGRLVRPAERHKNMAKETLARKGAFALQIVPGSDNDVIVRIDGGSPFRLTALPGRLLHFLATAEKSPDDMVGWRSIPSIAKCLAAFQGGRLPQRHAVINLICRLRKELAAHEENDRLIQTDRKLGYRFALRRNTRIGSGQAATRKERG